MELFGKQQHLYFINQDLADRVKALVAGTLGCGRDEAAALGLASQAFSLADQLINYFETENHLPHPIACREGCNFCCFNQVEVTPLEALGIGDYVGQSFSRDEKEALMARVSQSMNLKAGKSKKKLARLRQPAPLSPAGERPVLDLSGQAPGVPGHAHLCGRGPASRNCWGVSSGRGHIMPTVMSLSGPSVPGLQNGCREVGCQTGVLDLTRGLKDFFSRENPVKRWLSGEEVFGR